MIIETKYGKMEGVDKGSYIEYRGVPYAKPPVGDLRWRAPQEPDAWDGIYRAVDFKNRCVQEDHLAPPYDQDFYSNPDFARPDDEDCLYLQIWVPKSGRKHVEGTISGIHKNEADSPETAERPRQKKLPVAFWIHGGAFLGGFSSELEFDGKAYCDRGVILVSVEYRCNIFGFFAHPWLSAENERGISGNYGILDQIAALKWVYENIGAFGGDRGNITIFGQSAGAMSVQTLVSTELTGGMIAKAILQSGGSYGGGLHRDIPLKEQEQYGELFAEILHADSLEELRAKTTEEIRSATGKLMEKAMPIAKGLFLAPTLDGYVLDGEYYELMDAGKIKDIPYLLGTTRDDILVTPEMKEKGEFSALYQGCVAFSQKLEELGRNPAYVYYFTRNLPGDDFGAWHSSELWYMFGTLDRCWRPWEERDRELSSRMLDYWTDFMKTGDPNGAGKQVWKPCTREDPEVFELC
nr:carboxylesterase family protein [uncultured Schaedlerella sp.]